MPKNKKIQKNCCLQRVDGAVDERARREAELVDAEFKVVLRGDADEPETGLLLPRRVEVGDLAGQCRQPTAATLKSFSGWK